MVSEVQKKHLVLYYCIYEGHLTRFPCLNYKWQYYLIRWNIVHEEDIFGTYFSTGKRQILNIDQPVLPPEGRRNSQDNFPKLLFEFQESDILTQIKMATPSCGHIFRDRYQFDMKFRCRIALVPAFVSWLNELIWLFLDNIFNSLTLLSTSG